MRQRIDKLVHKPFALALLPPYTSHTLKRVTSLWGRHGFDMGRETFGACRGVEFLLNPATKL